MGKLTVGQKLWYVPRDSREVSQSREVTVTKIGRKWAEIDMGWGRGWRIDLDDWTVDGGNYSSPGRCHISREAWKAETERRRLWDGLFQPRYGGPPATVTTDAIYQAASLLGIELPARGESDKP